jgi:hypothetical protein
MRRMTVLTLLLFFVSQIALAQTPTGTWGSRGSSKRFAVDGDLLYSADGRGVTVYDISDPAKPHAVEVETAADETFDLALTASELVTATHRGVVRYARGSDGSLTRLDAWEHRGGTSLVAANADWVVAAAQNEVFVLERGANGPRIRHQFAFDHSIRALAFAGSDLYAAVEGEGIHVLDPQLDTPVTTLAKDADAMALSGTMLWGVSPAGGLMAVDVSDPASPRFVSATGLGTIKMEGVAAAGSRVYAFHAPDTVYFFDATDVQQPRLAATRTEWVNVMVARGTELFLSGPRLDADKFPYETETPLRAFDVGSIGTPLLEGEVHDYAGPVSGVWTDGSLAYVIDPPFFRVIDVSKTAAPKEITSIALPFNAPQTRVRVKNGLAIVYGRDYVHLVDVADPVRPRLVTTWFPSGHSPDDAAIIADGTFVELNSHSGIHVVDYVNYAPPVQIGGRAWHFHSVAAGDDAIYALGDGWMLTMSITNRATVKDATKIDKLNGVQTDSVPPNADRPTHLVVTQGTGLRVFDLADRFAPRQIGFVEAVPGQIATTADSVFADLDGTLYRLDIVKPNVLIPTEVHVISAMQISVAGEKVVVADRYSLRVFGPDTPPPPTRTSPRRRAAGHSR